MRLHFIIAAICLIVPQVNGGFCAFNGRFTKGSTAPLFSPLTLSPVLWLSDTGSNPATWPDISGNSRDATNGVAGRSPVIIAAGMNGKQIRRFDGADDLLVTPAISHTGQWTIISVAAITNSGDKLIYEWGGSYTVPGNVYLNSSSPNEIEASGLTSSYNIKTFTTPSLGNGVAKILTQQCDGTSAGHLLYHNGAAVSLTTSSSANPGSGSVSLTFRVGGRPSAYLAAGDYAEILIFPAALSTTDRQNVERYLGEKWGITVP